MSKFSSAGCDTLHVGKYGREQINFGIAQTISYKATCQQVGSLKLATSDLSKIDFFGLSLNFNMTKCSVRI